MESYLSFSQFLGRTANPVILVFVPIFVVATVFEAVLIMRRHGGYAWKNAGVSVSMAIGHFLIRAATHGLTLGIIAASVYSIRLTTIPVSFRHWPSLAVHHGSNAENIDKNYGGVLLIWDRLFGSYQAEEPDIPIRYGLVHPRSAPNNPLVIAYEELWLTLKAALGAGDLRKGLALVWVPP